MMSLMGQSLPKSNVRVTTRAHVASDCSSALSQVPDGVDTDKIEADYKKGVLTVTLPKKPDAQKASQKDRRQGSLIH